MNLLKILGLLLILVISISNVHAENIDYDQLYDEMITLSDGSQTHKYVFGIGTNSVDSSRSSVKYGDFYLTAILNYDGCGKKWGNIRFIKGYQDNFAGNDDNHMVEGHYISCMNLGGSDADFDVPTGLNHNSNYANLNIVWSQFIGHYNVYQAPGNSYGDQFLNPSDYMDPNHHLEKIEFDRDFYLNTYEDVKNANVGAKEHYLEYGENEGRYANQILADVQFNRQEYLDLNPDVAAAGMDPTEHYMIYGRFENGRKVHVSSESNVQSDESGITQSDEQSG